MSSIQNKLTKQILSEIMELSDKDKIPFYTKFFRANKGDICENDKILAIKVPELRKVIKKYYSILSLDEITFFFQSDFNEIRFFGQEVVSQKFFKTESIDEKKVYIDYMLNNIDYINHWNLVDNLYDIFSSFCWETKDYSILESLHKSDSIWRKRIAIVSNLFLIKKGKLDLAIKYIDDDLEHKHEYIQKACGWILREIGKKDEKKLILFLQQNNNRISSITRSYATEHLRKTFNIKELLQ